MLTFKSSGASAPKNNSNSVEVTAPMFFGANGFKPYFENRDLFLSYGESLRPTEVEELRSFFQYCNEGLRMTGNNRGRIDVAGRKYVWSGFNRARATPGAKVIIAGELERLIEDYQKGLISIAFTLDDLILEARNGN